MILRTLAACCVALAALLPATRAAAQETVTVFAAASLRNALEEVNTRFPSPRVTIRAAYAASSALARQVEAGAPAQVFISADLEWMDYLEKKGAIVPGTRKNLLGNRLVWIVPAGSAVPANPLDALAPGQRLALADPAHVPAGKYARAALERMGVWNSLAQRIAPAENVRAALAFVARREAPLGIVYETDARAEPAVAIAQRVDARLHPQIVYPAALIRGSASEAARYLEYLFSPQAAALFEKHGFSRP